MYMYTPFLPYFKTKFNPINWLIIHSEHTMTFQYYFFVINQCTPEDGLTIRNRYIEVYKNVFKSFISVKNHRNST